MLVYPCRVVFLHSSPYPMIRFTIPSTRGTAPARLQGAAHATRAHLRSTYFALARAPQSLSRARLSPHTFARVQHPGAPSTHLSFARDTRSLARAPRSSRARASRLSPSRAHDFATSPRARASPRARTYLLLPKANGLAGHFVPKRPTIGNHSERAGILNTTTGG